MKKVIFLFFTFCSVQLFAQTESPEQQQQEPTEQTQSETPVDQSVQENNTPLDVPSESVQMADPSSEAPAMNQSSGHTSRSGGNTETIRYYSGSHSGNNVTRTVEVELPEGSTTQRGY